MKSIRLRISPEKPKTYSIRIGTGLLESVPEILRRSPLGERYTLLTDTKTASLYGNSLLRRLRQSGLKCHQISIPPGERSKTRKTKAAVEDEMIRRGMGIDSALISLGGGVVGDLGGFVAATYCRGIPFLQIPTTLLAMVDSSIGGKTAVNHPAAKNWIGAFHQPAGVLIDISTLKSLPERPFRSGFAEVVKTAFIADRALFGYLERNIAKILDREEKTLARVVERCCRIKAGVVQKDETDANLRKILNFGHTVGHALERMTGFKLPHGEAVSIGMVAEAKIACRLRLLPAAQMARLFSLLQAVELPVRLPAGIRPARLIAATRLDKKARAGKAHYVLPAAIGRMARRRGSYSFPIPDRTVEQVLRELRQPS